MCGESARIRSCSSSGGRDQSSWRSSGPIFSAYVASPSCGRNSARKRRPRGDRPRGRRRVRKRRRVVARARSERGRLLRRGRHRAPRPSRMHADARLLVAGHDRALDRGRPSPPRQERRMDVQPLRRSSSSVGSALRSRRGRPRPPRHPSPAGRSGRRTGISNRCAISLAGGGAGFRPRPLGRSGRVSTYSISRRAAISARTSAPNFPVAATASFTTERGRPSAGAPRAPPSAPPRWCDRG